MDIAARTSSFWRFARKWPAQVPLRYKLIATELALVGIALAVISVTGINYLRSYLLNQQNQQLQAEVNSLLMQTNVQNYIAAELAGGGTGQHESTRFAADWLANGRLYPVISPVSGDSDTGIPQPVPGPRISTTASWLDDAYEPVIVGAQAGSGRWYVTSTPMAVVTPKGPVAGTLIVGIDLSDVYSTLGRLAGTDIFVSVILLLGLLILGLVIIRWSLRPLADLEQTADAVSAGNLDHRMAEPGKRTEFGRAGRSLNRMLGHIEAAARARSSSERAARRSEQRTRNLLADVSHELRTPLTAIRGFAEYYRHRSPARGSAHERGRHAGSAISGSADGVEPSHNGAGPQLPSDLERIVGRVEEESDRMAELLENMLLLAELGDDGALDGGPVDLLALTEDAVREARVTARHWTINLDSSDAVVDDIGALPVAGDKARLRKAIDIMMRNALSHAPEGTAIEVRLVTVGRAQIRAALSAAEAEPETWPGFLAADRDEPAGEPAAALLEVTDRGRSLTEEESRYAFDRSCRVGTVGSGLGLTVVATVVQAHQGAAWVTPQATRGTTYCMAVPLAKPARETDDDQAGAATNSPDLPDDLPSRQGMTVSELGGRPVSDAPGAGVAGEASTEQDPQTWIESGPPDEISF
jgi:two-component system, OmpR family, sensor kinase